MGYWAIKKTDGVSSCMLKNTAQKDSNKPFDFDCVILLYASNTTKIEWFAVTPQQDQDDFNQKGVKNADNC